MTDPQHLLTLAAQHLAQEPTESHQGSISESRRLLSELQRQKVRIVRAFAQSDQDDAPTQALADIAAEENSLRRQIAAMEQRQRLKGERASLEEQLRALADVARERLANPTEELMAQVFDLLGLDLHRVSADRFEGTGTIPIAASGEEPFLLLAGSAGEIRPDGSPDHSQEGLLKL